MATPRPGLTRRRLLVGLLLTPPALSGCSWAGQPAAPPDPLLALAAAARTDAAIAAAAIAAAPELAERVQPLVDARTAHAAALDTEIGRLDPERTAAAPTAAAPAPARPTLPDVRAAVLASGQAAAAAALELPRERVGVVASIAACCSTYAAVLA